MSIGQHYRDSRAHFLAGGATLQTIRDVEADHRNAKNLLNAIIRDYGDVCAINGPDCFAFSHRVKNPALSLRVEPDGKKFFYGPNPRSIEGYALKARIAAIPFDLSNFEPFAVRLTGATRVDANPDAVYAAYTPLVYRKDSQPVAASYAKIGDDYIVSVPVTIKGIFNHKADKDDKPVGYNYEWFTPPDSEQIPYSQVVALQERALGNQLTRHSILFPVPTPKP